MFASVHFRARRSLLLQATGVLISTAAGVHAADVVKPTAEAIPKLDYLMTLHAPLHAPRPVGGKLLVFHPRPGGWLLGKDWRASLESPTGDWVRVMENGSMRIDVRLVATLDDGELLYMSYGGVLKQPDAVSWSRFLKGERIAAPEWYYVIAPVFETASRKFAWLNDVQAVGKFVSIQTGEQAHVRFDIYAVR